MAQQLVPFGVRSRTLSKVGVSFSDQKIYYLQLLCFGTNVKPLVPAAFVVVSTHQSALDPRGGL
jgi:hypothetical protein